MKEGKLIFLFENFENLKKEKKNKSQKNTCKALVNLN